MRDILIACDSFKESLDAEAVGRAIAAGFSAVFPDLVCRIMPMADGGEGTAFVLAQAGGGVMRTMSVLGPLGQNVEASFAILGGTAVIEMAQAAGLHLVPPGVRDVRLASTRGVGMLIAAALDAGCSHIVLGLGGSATNDGGAGMAQALGVRFLDAEGRELPPGGAALCDLARIDRAGLDPRLGDVVVEVACDVRNPLCGPHGASAVFGPQKGANTEDIAVLDAGLARLAAVIARDGGPDLRDLPGAGAAGGLGAGAVAFLGGQLRAGVEIVADVLRLDAAIATADLVITGEGRLDGQSVQGKVPVGVARRALAQGVPVIAIAGSLGPGHEALRAEGILAAFSVVPGPCTLEDALAGAAHNLERTARNVAESLRIGQAASLRSGGAATGAAR